MENILITGGSGLIGHEIIKYYIKNTDYNIFQILRSKNIKNTFANSERIKNIYLDLNDELCFKKLPENINTIIHLAQSENYKNFPKYANEIFNINLRSTFQLLEYGRKNGSNKFFFASSGSVYENSIPSNIPITENSSLKTKSKDFYTVSKLAVENLISPYSEFMNIVIGRIFFPYGIRQKKNMFIPSIIERINNFQEVNINGDKGLIFNPTPVEFITECIFYLLKKDKKGIFNIASPKAISLIEYSEIISRVLNKKALFKYQSEINNQDFSVNVEKLFNNTNLIYEYELTTFIEKYKNEFF